MGLKCKCGTDFNTVGYPLETNGVMLTDKQIDDETDVKKIYRICDHYSKCVNCGRIFIESKEGNFWYKREENQDATIMEIQRNSTGLIDYPFGSKS